MRTASFRNGQEMWNHYNKGWWINPMEGLHLSCNTSIEYKMEQKSLGNSPTDDSLIIQARSYLMRAKIEDLFVNMAAEAAISDIEYEINEAFHAGQPNIPEYLSEVWDGFEESDYLAVINDFIGMLDPLTLQWVEPNSELHLTDDYQFIFNREVAVPETDPTFAYKNERGTKSEAESFAIETLYEFAVESFQDRIPKKVWNLHREVSH